MADATARAPAPAAAAAEAGQPHHAAFCSLGVATEVVLCEYDDRTAIFVSQGGRLGTLLLVTRQDTRAGAAQGQPSMNGGAPAEAGAGQGRWGGGQAGGTDALDEGDDEDWAGEWAPTRTRSVFHVSVLLGRRDEPLLSACARSISEGLSSRGCDRALFLALGLDPCHNTLDALRDVSRNVLAAFERLRRSSGAS